MAAQLVDMVLDLLSPLPSSPDQWSMVHPVGPIGQPVPGTGEM